MTARRREGLLILALFCIALSLRLYFAWPALRGSDVFLYFGDEEHYYQIALSLARGAGIAVQGQPTAYRMPFFSLTLAPWYALLGASPYAPQPFIILLSALTCVGVYLLGRQIFNTQIAIVAALISSFDYLHAIYKQG